MWKKASPFSSLTNRLFRSQHSLIAFRLQWSGVINRTFKYFGRTHALPSIIPPRVLLYGCALCCAVNHTKAEVALPPETYSESWVSSGPPSLCCAITPPPVTPLSLPLTVLDASIPPDFPYCAVFFSTHHPSAVKSTIQVLQNIYIIYIYTLPHYPQKSSRAVGKQNWDSRDRVTEWKAGMQGESSE